MTIGLPGEQGSPGTYGHGGTGGAGGRGGDPSGTGGAGGHGGPGGRFGGIWGRLAPVIVGLAVVVMLVTGAGIGYLSFETYHGNTPAHHAAVAANNAAKASEMQSKANYEEIQSLKLKVEELELIDLCERQAFDQVLGEALLHQPIAAPPKC